jgi:hypothetical protein
MQWCIFSIFNLQTFWNFLCLYFKNILLNYIGFGWITFFWFTLVCQDSGSEIEPSRSPKAKLEEAMAMAFLPQPTHTHLLSLQT